MHKLDFALHYSEFQVSVKPCPLHYFHMLLFLLLVQLLFLLEQILNFKRNKLRTWKYKNKKNITMHDYRTLVDKLINKTAIMGKRVYDGCK